MAPIKGGKIDAAGEKIISVRVVTDSDADTGIGGVLDPIRVDPVGTTVQPVSFSTAQHVIVDSGAGGGTQYADGTTQATPTGTAVLGKNPSNVLKTVSLDASGNVNVNLAAGSISGGNAAASATGSAVPASADYTGFNSGGNLVGVSSANPLPVSLASLPALVAGSAVIGHVIVDTAPSTAVTNAGTFAVQAALAAETTKVIGTVNVAAAQTIAVTQATAANLNATVVGPTLAKGTQGATGFSTQDLKDSGRTQVSFYLDGIAGVSTEALATMNITKGLVAQTAATSYIVTAGKTLRIQSLLMTISTTAATSITNAKVRLRGASASFSVSSPILAALACQPPTGVAQAGASATVTLDVPDGLELPAGSIVGLSQIVNTTSSTLTVAVIGYEY